MNELFGADTTDADMLHSARGIACHILDTPESFRAFAAVALRLLLEEGMEG